jgi:hypothetical protein
VANTQWLNFLGPRLEDPWVFWGGGISAPRCGVASALSPPCILLRTPQGSHAGGPLGGAFSPPGHGGHWVSALGFTHQGVNGRKGGSLGKSRSKSVQSMCISGGSDVETPFAKLSLRSSFNMAKKKTRWKMELLKFFGLRQ